MSFRGLAAVAAVQANTRTAVFACQVTPSFGFTKSQSMRRESTPAFGSGCTERGMTYQQIAEHGKSPASYVALTNPLASFL
jgi:hypothetical protein